MTKSIKMVTATTTVKQWTDEVTWRGGGLNGQRFLRCALHSSSQACDPRAGVCVGGGGQRGVRGRGVREGGAQMSRSTGGGAGGGARGRPPLEG